jgi:hypothetical protein
MHGKKSSLPMTALLSKREGISYWDYGFTAM